MLMHNKTSIFYKKLHGHKGVQFMAWLEKIGAVDGKNDYRLNTEELKIELDKLVLEHRVTPFLHALYVSACLEGSCVKAVFIENKDGRRAIRAKMFVDATGDGDLARDAGIPFNVRDGLQPLTTCAKISSLPKGLQNR